jgi:hypothetical protein
MKNRGNSLILRCMGAQAGGTAHFASQVIGEREVRRMGVRGCGDGYEQGADRDGDGGGAGGDEGFGESPRGICGVRR